MKRKKKISIRKLMLTAGIAIVFMLTTTYIGLSFYFENHYFFNTTINGEDYSYKTPVEAEMMLHADVEDYVLEIEGREGISDRIFSGEIDMEYVLDSSLHRIRKEQKAWQWILGFFRDYSYELYHLISYDEEKLDQALAGLAFFEEENIRQAKEAYISYLPEEKRYTIIEASPGTEIWEERVGEAVRLAFADLRPGLNLEEAGCYRQERKQQGHQGLEEAKQQANVYVSADVTYDWNGSQVTVNGDMLQRWIHIENDKVTLKEDEIREFLLEQAESYDTFGRNKTFHTTDGRDVELNTQAYGWETDIDAEHEALLQAIKAGKTIEKEPAHSYTEPAKWQVEIGDSFVEMDLSNQHLYLYVEGELILESDFVSGNASRGWSTPAGVFGLTYKTRDAVLRGEGYATPVSYWMPFNGNIGMHDATWRGSFGGDIYKTNGSHGCINLPYENAKIIYEYMYTGFPIVCYY